MFLSTQYFTKYGSAIKAMPIRIIRNTLETKYGKAHRTTPDRRAMPLRCFLPYIKYPIPIEPYNTPHIIDVVLSIIFLYFFRQQFNNMPCQNFVYFSMPGNRLRYFGVLILIPVMSPTMSDKFAAHPLNLFN